jgi:hypothetical protein
VNQPHIDKPHLLQAQRKRYWLGRWDTTDRIESSSLANLQQEADSKWPGDRVVIRDEYTSDMTYHGAGNGRVVAERIAGEWRIL